MIPTLHDALNRGRERIQPRRYDPREIAALPPPVQRYFHAVLTEGQPLVAAVRLRQAGTFNMSETAAARWKPFTATQHVVTRRPGFVWDARMAMFPGVPVRVHDAYVAGEGLLRAALFGLFTLAQVRGTRDMAEGELMRFLAEAAWYPTLLLPGQGVRWEAVDDATAKAFLTDGPVSVALAFRFDEGGLIESVRADARGRTVKGEVVPTPWEGRWSRYDVRGGMRVPLEGEAVWLLPDGARPYWRGQVTDIDYEVAA